MKTVYILAISSTLFATSGETLYIKYGCYGCHGSDAKGTNQYPKIANLPTPYIVKKLTSYKEGKINSNRANIMKPFAKKLSKKDIEKLAEYLHNFKIDESEYYEEFETGSSVGS